MRPPRLGTLIAIAACLIIAIPASASAIPIHEHHFKNVDGRMYEVTTVVHVAPPDSDEDGLRNGDDGCPAVAGPDGGCPEPEPVASTSSTDVIAPAPATTSVAPAPATTSSGGCPSYMAAEATSPDAVNPTSGAAGCYQVLPSTAAAMGAACSDVNADSCVAAICASQGNGAWASSGATPCG